MVRLAAAVVAVLTAVGSVAAGRDRGVFELEGGASVSGAVLTVSGALPAGPVPSFGASSPMLLNLSGSIAELSGPQVAVLARCVRTSAAAPPVDAGAGFRRVCIVQLLDGKGAVAKRVELLTGFEGVTVARELGPTDAKPASSAVAGRTVVLDAEKYRQVSLGWARYRGPFAAESAGLADQSAAPPAKAGGVVEEMAKPIVPAPMYLDEKTFGERFISGGRANVLKVARKLNDERFFLRVPAAYDPRTPAGLLVYINAAPDGKPPGVLFKALDELGIACVGIENAGNDRPVVDRFQLVFDAVFAASERVHVDPRRVYLSGISGGGRCASRLQCCFPDYFTGAAPIVGLSTYFNVPLGGGKHSPAGFDRPNTARFAQLRTRRLGVLTGPADFNYAEIVAAAKGMKGDGLQVRVFEHEMGHQLPTAEWFLETLRWVDEPYRETVAKEAAEAQRLLDAYLKKWGEAAPEAKNVRAREELAKVTRVGPWTPAAWRAVELLK
ncbi:MAG TPA: hypothetical protein VFF65_01855 [Phycisphaerales bacterium]|nr:hypothetical protein [Phycisphaerales bacterium]